MEDTALFGAGFERSNFERAAQDTAAQGTDVSTDHFWPSLISPLTITVISFAIAC